MTKYTVTIEGRSFEMAPAPVVKLPLHKTQKVEDLTPSQQRIFSEAKKRLTDRHYTDITFSHLTHHIIKLTAVSARGMFCVIHAHRASDGGLDMSIF